MSFICLYFLHFIFGVFKRIWRFGIWCIFSSTLQPKSGRTAGAFCASIFVVSAAENPENSGSSLNQNSTYLLVGTIPYSRKIVCYGWCAIRRCHGQSGIKGSFCQGKNPVFEPDEEVYRMVTECQRRWMWQLLCSGYTGKANTLAHIKWRLAGLLIYVFAVSHV